MVTVTYDGSQLKFYRNSLTDGYLNKSGNIQSTSNPLYIGKRATTGDYRFNGKLDDIRIYNRALTQSEITALYNESPCTLPSPIVQNVSNCGSGSVTLTAGGGAAYNWYNSLTGGSVIGTGPTYTTPYLMVSDTFWVSNVDTCESARVPIIVTIKTTHITQNDTTICSGSDLSLSITGDYDPIPTTGLVAYYPFNGNANDESGNGHNGTVYLATLTSDKLNSPNSAYYFNGSSTGANICKISSNLESSLSRITISMWVNADYPINWYPNLIRGENTYNIVEAGIHPAYLNPNIVGNVASYPNVISSGLFRLKVGQWHHVVMTHDYIENSRKLVIDDTIRGSISISSGISGSSSLLTIGNSANGTDSDGKAGFKGKIDNIRIYNHALSDWEISALFNETSIAQSSNYSYLWSTDDTTALINVTPPQTTTYTVTITNGPNSCTDNVTVTVSGSSISGKLTYDNDPPANTPLSCSKVLLKTTAGITIDSTDTDNNGDYRFCNIPDGSYKLSAKTAKAPGGINSTDALMAAKHFVQMITLTGIRLEAGDVNGTGYINSTDAVIIAKRYTQMINTFSVGDWIFEEPAVVLSGTSSNIVNLKGLCVGDVNGSYNPPGCGFQSCGDTLTDERDGQKYSTIQIGTQCWMKKNLNVGTMINGSQNQSNNSISEKYCHTNDPANCEVYGALYQWNEMMNYSNSAGIQGICPSGWHIPTDGEWLVLSNMLGGEVIAGGKMKEAGFTHWVSPNTGATNESGFSAFGTGARSYVGDWLYLNAYGYYWTSSEYDTSHAWCRVLSNSNTTLLRDAAFHGPKGNSFAVRCIKD